MISAIIIDYKSYQMSYDYVGHLIEKSDMPISVVIVDNSDSEENFKQLIQVFEKGFEQKSESLDFENFKNIKINQLVQLTVERDSKNISVLLAKNVSNSGFAKGNNIGIHLAKAIFNPQRLLITNNDIEIMDSHALSKMNAVFDKKSKVCVVGPYVEGIDGIRQSPHREMSLSKRWILPYMFWPFYSLMWRINQKWVERVTSDIVDVQKSGQVYRVIGAFFMADTERFYDIGLFDEKTFLYSEEMIIADRIIKHGYYAYYCHDIMIVHEQGTTTKKAMNSEKRLKSKFESEVYYYTQYRKASQLGIKLASVSIDLYIKTNKILALNKE